jgi:putative nucleotidyltransferase with HDIG domain
LGSQETDLFARLDNHHPYTFEHSQRVAGYADRAARALGLSMQERRGIERCALLHDVGKIEVSVAILDGTGKPTDEQWQVLRAHSDAGDRLTRQAGAPDGVARAVRGVHERVDGGGYPDGLKGEAIPLAARIIAVCDAYDAITFSGRRYREPVGPDAARRMLSEEVGTHFDPRVAEAFFSTLPGAQAA